MRWGSGPTKHTALFKQQHMDKEQEWISHPVCFAGTGVVLCAGIFGPGQAVPASRRPSCATSYFPSETDSPLDHGICTSYPAPPAVGQTRCAPLSTSGLREPNRTLLVCFVVSHTQSTTSFLSVMGPEGAMSLRCFRPWGSHPHRITQAGPTAHNQLVLPCHREPRRPSSQLVELSLGVAVATRV